MNNLQNLILNPLLLSLGAVLTLACGDPASSSGSNAEPETESESESESDTESVPADPCMQVPVNDGMCDAAIPAWAFDPETGECYMWAYNGCDGVVPFDSLESCLAECGGEPAETGDTSGEDDCGWSEESLAYDEVDLNGLSAVALLAIVEPQAGNLTYDSGATTGMDIDVVYTDGDITSRQHVGDEPSCTGQSYLFVEVTMLLKTADGQFAEEHRAILKQSSVEPDVVEIEAIDMKTDLLAGSYQPPEEINGHGQNEFVTIDLSLHGIMVGPARNMSSGNDVDLGPVHGAIYGQGMLNEPDCSDVPGEACMGVYSDFFVGSFIYE